MPVTRIPSLASSVRRDSVKPVRANLLARVRDQVRRGHLAADRDHVADPAEPLLPHMGDRRHRAIDGPPEIRGHGALDVVQRHGLHGPDLDDPGVVDQDVHAPVTLDREVDEVPALLAVGDVGGHGQDVAGPGVGHLDLGGVEVLGVARRQDELRAVLRGVPRNQQPVPRRGPGDDHNTIVERDPPRGPHQLPGTPGDSDPRQRADHDPISEVHRRLLSRRSPPPYTGQRTASAFGPCHRIVNRGRPR